MPYGTHLHLFRQGVKPVWEDSALEEGCQLEIKSSKNQTSKFWEDLLLAMLGEQFSEPNFVCGMIMKLKP
jgi:translation initiation factor 4E